MPSYIYNNLSNYNDNVNYDATSTAYQYDSDINYDYNVDYNSSNVNIFVGLTQFDFNKYAPRLSERAIISIPSKAFILSSFNNIKVLLGASVKWPITEFDLTSGVSYFKVTQIKFTAGEIPAEHVEDAQLLDADAYVDLFQITLSDKNSKIYLKMNKEANWQGNLYESHAVKIDGVAKYADGEVSRPKFSLYNPEGVYSALVDEGLLDAATVIRYRLLKDDLENDRPIYRRQQWKVSRISSINNNAISLELRDLMDGQIFSLPGRMFIPPDFPTVGI